MRKVALLILALMTLFSSGSHQFTSISEYESNCGFNSSSQSILQSTHAYSISDCLIQCNEHPNCSFIDYKSQFKSCFLKYDFKYKYFSKDSYCSYRNASNLQISTSIIRDSQYAFILFCFYFVLFLKVYSI